MLCSLDILKETTIWAVVQSGRSPARRNVYHGAKNKKSGPVLIGTSHPNATDMRRVIAV
jgi:hypothetical protein